MSYFKLVLKVAIREPIVWIGTAFLAGILSICLIIPYPLFGPDLLRQTMNMNYKVLSESMTNGAYDGAPAQIVEEAELRLQYLRTMLNANTSSEFYTSLARLYALDEEASSSGSLIGSTQNEMSAAKKYAEVMSEVGELPEYDSSIQLPAVFLASVAPSTLPQFVLPIPAIAIVFAVSKITSKKKLLGSTVIPAGISVLSKSAVGVVICLVSFLLSCAPVLLGAILKNGFGSHIYPMVFLKGGSIVETTVGQAALWTIMLIMLTWLFLSVFGICISSLSKNTLAGVFGTFILALIPSAPSYYSAGSPIGFLL